MKSTLILTAASLLCTAHADAALRLAIRGGCPSDGATAIHLTGGAPGSTGVLFVGGQQGRSLVPRSMPCAGTTLGVSRIVYTQRLQFDREGEFSATSRNTRFCGMHFQALDIRTCETSNVASAGAR